MSAKPGAKGGSEEAPQEEELYVTGKLSISNRHGLSLIDLLERVRVLEQQVAELPALKVKVTSLENRVLNLTNSLYAYKLLRNRFISTFKRDKLENATDED